MHPFVSPDDIRTRFSHAMSAMYRAEVPLYGELIAIVADTNRDALARDPALRDRLARSGDLARLDSERHGAIRVGTAAELSMLRRVFAVMGMFPVGYYDLASAGVPVHSTAFRPIDEAALRANPFRIFTSLLRLDLIADDELRARASAILATRRIVSDEALALVELAERQGGLAQADAEEFVREVLETFRWRSEALVDCDTYQQLSRSHRLIADVVSFLGPHINHLTPRTLDIDAAHAEMRRRGFDAKDTIEGPPPRAVPILLRQTSFKALEEPIRFAGADGRPGTHTARFGEIEQRGIALTPAGRALYDRCLAAAQGSDGEADQTYADRLAAAFAPFPDDLEELRAAGLAYFRYEASPAGQEAARNGHEIGNDLTSSFANGWIVANPLTYEDFLPVSAAGIFRSNLGDAAQDDPFSGASSQPAFEAALGAPVADPFELYAAAERASLAASAAAQPI